MRDDRTRIVATLIRLTGDFDLAEDALQDALLAAADSWSEHGIPDNPGGWVFTTARRRAIDRIRREQSQRSRAQNLAILKRLEEPAIPSPRPGIEDDRLRLIFTCCHPALNVSSRVALTLRVVAGLSTREIARAYLVSEATMGKRLVRAKRKIAEAHISYAVPDQDELPERLDAVLAVIYLIFNEGYLATGSDSLARPALIREAIRLAELLTGLVRDPEALGLLALLLLTDSRGPARESADRPYVSLLDQDRSLWDQEHIERGLSVLSEALALGRPGRYALHACIAALESTSEAGSTPWPEIADVYRSLFEIRPDAVVAVNWAAATSFAQGPEAGWQLLQPFLVDRFLQGYAPLHALAADLHRRLGQPREADDQYQHAIMASANNAERRELERRLSALRTATARQ